jgi:DNA protecting protein DprA
MMNFGLDAETVARLVAGMSRRTGTLEPAERDARFARAAWSGVVEPGDGTAGALIEVLGADTGFTALIEQWSIERVLGAVRDVDESAASALAPELTEGLARWKPRLRSAQIVRALEHAARVGARLIMPTDPERPAGLDDLGRHAPIVLWRRGSDTVLDAPDRAIAVVGARAATGYGEHVTMEASAGLVERGFAIVSGAAYGIDGMAHRAALATHGTTIAFLAGGVDRFYPAGHDALLTRIAQEGAVMSEMPCGSAPTKWRFLQRNRLIAAATEATIVVEAGRRSGSLNTAGHAAALGRPLGAVPGPVTSPTSAGCHRLIRDYDAVCVTTAQEMAELVDGVSGGDPLARTGVEPTGDQVRVLDALSSRSPRAIGDIAARSGLSVATVSAVLGAFDLDAVVEERERGWVLARAVAAARR